MYKSEFSTESELKEKQHKLVKDMKDKNVIVTGCAWVYYKGGKRIDLVAQGFTDNSEAKAKVTPETPLGVASLKH